jgi:hypothetical protein
MPRNDDAPRRARQLPCASARRIEPNRLRYCAGVSDTGRRTRRLKSPATS